MANFEKAFKKTAKHEGGWVNDPDDGGGETYCGVARKKNPDWSGWRLVDKHKKVYKPNPTRSSKYTDNIFDKILAADKQLQESVLSFYKPEIWGEFKLDNFSSQVLAENVFDFATTSRYDAVKQLQKLVGVKADGFIGSGTLAAIETKIKSSGELGLINAFQDVRETYYHDLAKHEKYKKYEDGWINRCNKMRNDQDKLKLGTTSVDKVKNDSSCDNLEFSNTVKIGELSTKVQEMAKKHIANCKENGIDLIIYQARTHSDQGCHGLGLAYDCGPLLNGKIALNRTDLFKKVIGPLGVASGLEWGGNFQKPEWPHFQYTGGLLLSDFIPGNALGSQNILHRASGGSVNSNSPYMVGEEGPELFVPGTGGTIINNTILKALLNNSGTSRNITNSENTNWSEKLFGNWKKTFKESTDQMGDWSTNMKNVVASTAQSMQSTMSTVFLDALQGKLKSFKDYFKSFANSIVQSLQNALANSFSSSIMKYISGLFGKSSSILGSNTVGSSLSVDMCCANGGAVTGGNTYLVGERGPELFVANTGGTIIPNHQLGVATSTAAPQVTVNVINNSGQSVSARQESGFDGQGYVVDVWLDALNRNVGGLRDVVLAGR